MSVATESPSDYVNLTFRDWRRSKEVHLDQVPRSATVREVLGEAVRAMELPVRKAFRAAFRGRQLNDTETLADVGVTSEDEAMTVLPSVSAGR